MKIKLDHHIIAVLQNLYAFKLRTGLALLWIIIGAASVVALISTSQLATQHALAQFTNLGTNLLAVNIEPSSNASNDNKQTITPEQIKFVKESSTDILLAAPYTTNYLTISFAQQSLPTNVMGANEELASIMKINLIHGRFISHLDKAQYFCVLGYKLAEKLAHSDAEKNLTALIGQQILLGHDYFTVVGITNPWLENMFLYTDINNAVIIPLAASLTLTQTGIQNIVFKLKTGTDNEQVQQIIEQELHRQTPDIKLFFRNAKELIANMQEQRRTFTLLLGAIGTISLIVGGIGVMNVMLIAVMERRQEIGIRMAVGAKCKDIREMFLTEAIILATIGGAIGTIIGTLVSLLLAIIHQWTFHLYIIPIATGFIVSVLVGIISGYYPAHQASRLNPIEALRLN